MCHLTATNQRSFKPVGKAEYVQQLDVLLKHHDSHTPSSATVRPVYINLMARGEPLANRELTHGFANIFQAWNNMCATRGLTLFVNVSTIVPTVAENLAIFPMFGKEFSPSVRLYYSMYSLSPTFRRKWLPNAMDPFRAMDMLRDIEMRTKVPITFHWPLIRGENDGDEDIEEIVAAIAARRFEGRYHLVRFNPPPGSQYQEPPSDRLEAVLRRMSKAFPDPKKSKMIPRVGEDVHASCGTFFTA